MTSKIKKGAKNPIKISKAKPYKKRGIAWQLPSPDQPGTNQT